MIVGKTFAIPLLNIEAVYRSAEQTIVQYSLDQSAGPRHSKMIVLDTSDEEHQHILNSFKKYHKINQTPKILKVKKKKAILKAKIQDLKKARWYLDRKIEQLQSKLSKAKCR